MNKQILTHYCNLCKRKNFDDIIQINNSVQNISNSTIKSICSEHNIHPNELNSIIQLNDHFGNDAVDELHNIYNGYHVMVGNGGLSSLGKSFSKHASNLSKTANKHASKQYNSAKKMAGKHYNSTKQSAHQLANEHLNKAKKMAGEQYNSTKQSAHQLANEHLNKAKKMAGEQYESTKQSAHQLANEHLNEVNQHLENSTSSPTNFFSSLFGKSQKKQKNHKPQHNGPQHHILEHNKSSNGPNHIHQQHEQEHESSNKQIINDPFAENEKIEKNDEILEKFQDKTRILGNIIRQVLKINNIEIINSDTIMLLVMTLGTYFMEKNTNIDTKREQFQEYAKDYNITSDALTNQIFNIAIKEFSGYN
jgi:vacuolar-type H+-ATPase subunit H